MPGFKTFLCKTVFPLTLSLCFASCAFIDCFKKSAGNREENNSDQIKISGCTQQSSG